MIKQSIISQIASKFNQMGITYQTGNGTDIAVFTEFLDAGWSTGSKKITYEASVFADEASNTVFMWEITKETGHGLSFGGESGSYFQSGRTLFCKVKSVQYGPDGKAYEYTLDIGAIPKAVKEAAKQHGWKFKTVLRRDKASWPAGYVSSATNAETVQQSPDAFQQEQPQGGSFCVNCGRELAPDALFCPKCGTKKQGDGIQQQDEHAWRGGNGQQPQQVNYQPEQQPYAAQPPGQQNYNPHSNPQGPFHANAQRKGSGKGGTFGLIGFILLGILLIAMLAAGKATPAGWIISAIVFAVAFFIQRKLSGKGCLLHLVLWIITGFILLVILTVTTTDSIGFTTAKLKNAHMTTAMDQSGKPVDTVRSYAADTPELVAVAELRNAPSNTKVKFVWLYVTGNVNIAEYTVDSGDRGANIYVFSTLTNDKPWPEGEYKVEMYIEGRKTPDAVVDFTVGTKNVGTGESSLNQTDQGMQNKQVFLVDNFQVQWLGYGLKNAHDNGVSSYIILSLNSTYPSIPKSIKMTIKPKSKPKQGRVILFRQNPIIAMSPRYTQDSEKFMLTEEFDVSITDNSEDNTYLAYHRQVGGQLRFFYDIVDIPSDKKFTSDDLRTTAVFNIQIETEDGKKHIINFEREIFPGDFMSKNVDYEAYNETYSVTDPQIYSKIIN